MKALYILQNLDKISSNIIGDILHKYHFNLKMTSIYYLEEYFEFGMKQYTENIKIVSIPRLREQSNLYRKYYKVIAVSSCKELLESLSIPTCLFNDIKNENSIVRKFIGVIYS